MPKIYALFLLLATTTTGLHIGGRTRPCTRGRAPLVSTSMDAVVFLPQPNVQVCGLPTTPIKESVALLCRGSASEVAAMARVLAKCRKQGAWLRGLVGAVVVEAEDSVKILASGRPERLQSFAEWARRALQESSVSVSLLPLKEAESLCGQFALRAAEEPGAAGALEQWEARVAPLLDEGLAEIPGWTEEKCV